MKIKRQKDYSIRFRKRKKSFENLKFVYCSEDDDFENELWIAEKMNVESPFPMVFQNFTKAMEFRDSLPMEERDTYAFFSERVQKAFEKLKS